MTEREREGLFISLVASFGSGLAVTAINAALRSPYVVLPATALVEPQAGSALAQAVDGTEEEFILSAWEWVGRNIAYAAYGSDLEFMDSRVRCARCLLPGAVLRAGRGNCLGKSGLLASILRNRLPADRVLVAVGDAALDGVGGHAWVEVLVGGQWYILEATSPPGLRPWRPVSVLRSIYIPYAYVNDIYFSCLGGSICISLSDCPCSLDIGPQGF